jgi:hypothetical protein
MFEVGTGQQAQPLQMVVMITANINGRLVKLTFNSHDLYIPGRKFRCNHPTLAKFG